MVSRARARLRSLERFYAKELAENSVRRFAYCLLLNWDAFMDADMCALDIIRKMRVHPKSLDTWSKAMNYINKCAKEGHPPDRRALITTLAPWTAKRRPW